MSLIFGPIPSRRVGRSLGVDVVPAKTCSFDCIYCESGPTTRLTVKRTPFFPIPEVMRELGDYLRANPKGTDVITFSSAGEPTLFLGLGELIEAIKRDFPDYPLMVLTNGSLLWDPQVRRDLLKADRVVPSLDSALIESFLRINRPHPSLELDAIVEGIIEFRSEYRGQMHLEIVLADGVNDSPDELKALARAAGRIRPDKVELNTVVRPPAFAGTRGLTEDRMARAAACFPKGTAEIIGVFHAPRELSNGEDLGRRILETIERRPCTVAELSVSLGIPEEVLEHRSKELQQAKKLVFRPFEGKDFLYPAGK
ncbi:MAG: radical SAM protein [Desulfobacteraceae bacterium]|nr:radical SAM protein [Desulfobacteraceae bacterium]